MFYHFLCSLRKILDIEKCIKEHTENGWEFSLFFLATTQEVTLALKRVTKTSAAAVPS